MAGPNEIQMKEAPPPYDVGKLDGIEKASILLLSLSEDDAAQILKFMQPKQVQALGGAMAAMDDMTQQKINAVHKHFIEEIQNYSTIGFKSEEFVRRTLVTALGEDKAAHLLDQILAGAGAKGLESLKWMDSKQVANIIRNEHPQIQTIVMSYLEPEQSADSEFRRSAACSLARIKRNYGKAICWTSRSSGSQDGWLEICCQYYELLRYQYRSAVNGLLA